MKKLLLLLITAAVLGCTAPEDKALAKAGKDKVTQGEFDNEVAKLQKAMLPEDYTMSEEEKTSFDKQVLNNMIMKKVYTRAMDKMDIQVDPTVVATQFEQLIAQYGSEENLVEDIESKGFTVDELKAEFNYQLRLSELRTFASESETVVPEEDIKTYYEENKDTVFQNPATINSARHILIQIEDVDTNIALDKIKTIREEIVAGKDFAEAAKEYSQGPSSVNGGQLGQFSVGQMVKEFEMVAFAIPLNEVSEPVLTQFGYHLILVEDRSESEYAPFEETKEYIAQNLKVEQFFANIEEDAKITKPDWASLD